MLKISFSKFIVRSKIFSRSCSVNDSKYAFESLTEQERENIFERTMNLLKEILSKASKSFLPDGYRAGGLYIQPFSSFKKYFDKYGIRYEFSVLKNAAGELENQNIQFNFSGVEKNIYRFSNDIVQEDKSGAYTQFALQFVDVPLVPRLLNSIFYRLFSKTENHQMHGDGISTSNKIYSTAKNKFSSTETFSVEMLNEIKLPLYLKEAKQNNYLHLLSHPKLVSDYNLQQFDNLLKKLIALGNTEFDFKKFELAEQ